jgi:hypothetical protein
MRRKIMAYSLGNVIRKEYEQYNEQPNDIGTKPVPGWLQNRNVKDEIEQLFTEKRRDDNKKLKKKIERLFIEDMNKNRNLEEMNNKESIEQLFIKKGKQNDNFSTFIS